MIGERIKTRLQDVRDKIPFGKNGEMNIIPSVRDKIEEVSLRVRERVRGKDTIQSKLTREIPVNRRGSQVRHIPTITPKSVFSQPLPKPKKRGF